MSEDFDLASELRALSAAMREHNQRVREVIEAREAHESDARCVLYPEPVDWESTLADIRNLPEDLL